MGTRACALSQGIVGVEKEVKTRECHGRSQRSCSAPCPPSRIPVLPGPADHRSTAIERAHDSSHNRALIGLRDKSAPWRTGSMRTGRPNTRRWFTPGAADTATKGAGVRRTLWAKRTGGGTAHSRRLTRRTRQREQPAAPPGNTDVSGSPATRRPSAGAQPAQV